jgi:hypothetical protein
VASVRRAVTLIVALAVGGLGASACSTSAPGQGGPPTGHCVPTPGGACYSLPTTISTSGIDCAANDPLSDFYGKADGDLRIVAVEKSHIYPGNVEILVAWLIQFYGACMSGIDFSYSAQPIVMRVYFPPSTGSRVVDSVDEFFRAQVKTIASSRVLS